MTIEFRCTSCDKLLRTQAGTEGKKAKCPQCGTVLVIPFTSAPDAAPASSPFAAPPREPDFSAPPPRDPVRGEPSPPPYQAAANPYQSPGAYGAAATTVQRGFHPTRIELGETLSRTWEIYKANLGACIGGTLLMMACSIGVGYLVQLIFMPVMLNVDGAVFLVVMLLQQVTGQALGVFFAIGIILFMLRIARGEAVEFGALFSGGPYFLYGLVIQIVVSLAMLVGLVLLVIPAFIFGLMLSQSTFILVDQRAGIVDSLKLSIAAMKGNKLTVLAIWIIAGGLGLLVTILTCFIGGLFVLPFMALLTAVVYLRVTGQQTVLDAPAQAAAERGFRTPGAKPAGG